MIHYLSNQKNLGDWEFGDIMYQDSSKFFEVFSTYCNTTNRMGYDLETNGLDPYTGKVLLVTFGNEDNQFIIPGNRLEVLTAFEIIKQEEILLFAHHAKFDWKWGIVLVGIIFTWRQKKRSTIVILMFSVYPQRG